MADNLVEILIKFGLDKSKATEAAAQIKDIQTASTEAGKAGVKAATEQAEATEKGTRKIEGMHKAMNLLESKLGEFGHVVKFIMSPEALGVAALAIGLDKIFEHFKKIKEEAEEAALKMQAMEQAKLDGLQTALKNTKTAAADLREQIAGAGHDLDTLKEHFDSTAAARAAAGLSSDEAGELKQRYFEQPGLTAAAEAARNAASKLDENPEFIAAVASAAAGQETTGKLRGKLGKALAGYGSMGELEKLAASDTAEDGGYFVGKLTKAKEAQEELNQHLATMAGYQATIDAHDAAKKAAEQEATYRTGAATTNAARVEELSRKQRIGESAALGGRGASALDFAEDIAARFAAGGKVSKDEKEIVRSVATVGSGQNATFELAVKMLQANEQNKNAHTRFLERMLAALEASGGINAGFDRRLTMLENRIKSESLNP